MNVQEIKDTVAQGVPFTLFMADGKEYNIPHADYIWIPPQAPFVMVYDDNGHYTLLPLLMVTGLRASGAGFGKDDSRQRE